MLRLRVSKKTIILYPENSSRVISREILPMMYFTDKNEFPFHFLVHNSMVELLNNRIVLKIPFFVKLQ